MIVGKCRQQQQGMVYLWALFLVFLLGLMLGKGLEVYSTLVKREKEADLLYIGNLYRQAIYSYYLSSPGYQKKFPEKLTDLLKDPRYLTNRRYLRQLYRDPMTQQAFTEVMSPEGGIMGVSSSSTKNPIKQGGFTTVNSGFGQAEHYSDWQFVAQQLVVK